MQRNRQHNCNNLILLGFKLFGKACGQLCAHENCSWRPVAVSQDRERRVLTMLAVPPHEARPARALPADVVAVSSILALADRGTVLPKIPQGTPCNTSRGRGRGVKQLLWKWKTNTLVQCVNEGSLLQPQKWRVLSAQGTKTCLVWSGLKHTPVKNEAGKWC